MLSSIVIMYYSSFMKTNSQFPEEQTYVCVAAAYHDSLINLEIWDKYWELFIVSTTSSFILSYPVVRYKYIISMFKTTAFYFSVLRTQWNS